jgi:hypothetical protein
VRGGGPRLTGVVDTLTAGYGVVNRRPWIVGIPVLLDLFLWFGPQVSIAPLVGQLLSRPAIQRGLGAEGTEAFESVRQAVIAAADEINLLGLLSPGWVSVPSIMPALGVGQGPFTFIDSWSTALLIAVVAVLGGAFLGCIFRSIVAQQIREGVILPARIPGEAAQAWLRLLGLLLFLIGAILVLGVPAAFLVALATLLARELGSFGMALITTLLLWMQLYLFFAPDAIFVSQIGPRKAIVRSVAVVRANFWATLRIIVLMTVIVLGMGQVWIAVATRLPWGAALSILGNAYIASGLVAASMLFYRERVEALPSRRAVAAAREV